MRFSCEGEFQNERIFANDDPPFMLVYTLSRSIQYDRHRICHLPQTQRKISPHVCDSRVKVVQGTCFVDLYRLLFVQFSHLSFSTGASAGIGKSCAYHFASCGSDLVRSKE